MVAENLLRELKASQIVELETCVRCGACSEVCPVYEQDKSIIAVPALKLQELRKIIGKDVSIMGLISSTSKVNLKELRKAAEAAYLCTLCGRCWIGCIIGIRNRELREVLRSMIYKAGYIPEPLKNIDELLMKYKNPYGSNERLEWLKKLDFQVPVNVKGSDILYFVGCTSAIREPNIAKSTVHILRSVGENWTIMNNEWCCGSTWISLGNMDAAKNFAERNVKEIESLNIEKVVVSCAECYRMFKWEYPELNVNYNFEVLHISELINKYLNEGKLKINKRIIKKITYHDPCSLSRLGGIINEPRNVLRQIIPREAEFHYLVEMPENKMNTYCCGGGAFLEFIHPELTLKIAEHRLNQASKVEAEILVSACPICKITFTNAANKINKNIKVYDITELVAENISVSPQ
ncbi:MAG: (Fe-S)-binding protein [Candidatus Methanomethylicia archaeon]